MATFKDCEGHQWTIRVTSGHLLDLKDRHGIDLRDAFKPEAADNSLVAVFGDLEKFGQVMWFFCEDQARKLGLDERQFAYRFDGETADAAATALSEAVLTFSHPRNADKATAAFRAKRDQISDVMGKAWDQVANSPISGNGAANSAGAPESTPVPSASAS